MVRGEEREAGIPAVQASSGAVEEEQQGPGPLAAEGPAAAGGGGGGPGGQGGGCWRLGRVEWDETDMSGTK